MGPGRHHAPGGRHGSEVVRSAGKLHGSEVVRGAGCTARGGAGRETPDQTGRAPRSEVVRGAGETSGRVHVRRAGGCHGPEVVLGAGETPGHVRKCGVRTAATAPEVALGTCSGRHRVPGERYGSAVMLGTGKRHGPKWCAVRAS